MAPAAFEWPVGVAVIGLLRWIQRGDATAGPLQLPVTAAEPAVAVLAGSGCQLTAVLSQGRAWPLRRRWLGVEASLR